MLLYHNSRLARCRSPYGAVPVCTTVTITADADLPEEAAVYLRLWDSAETLIPMESRDGRFTASVRMPESAGLVWYHFIVDTPDGRLYYGKDSSISGGAGMLTETPPDSWQITVYVPTELPRWYGEAVAYQIFPDRFHRGSDWAQRQADAAFPEGHVGPKRMVLQDWNDTPFYCKDAAGRVIRWPFFGGTLEGIREKLSYLKSLGVGVVYLNPIFKAQSNHKYDTADYMTVDPAFGDEEAFSRLCAEAKSMGIRILLDGVFSHTGDDSIYFNRYGNYPELGAYARQGSPYDGWYRFTGDHPAGYECWWDVDSLPNVEENDPTYREFICGEKGVIRKWLGLGASGWRLDVADELPDDFIKAIRAAGKAEKADALLMGEVWEDATNKISYDQLREYFLGEELDCTMHYPFRTAALDFLLERTDSAGFAEAMEVIRENYPPTALHGALNLVGTHDTPRVLTVLGEAPEGLTELQKEDYRLPAEALPLAKKRLRLLQVLQFTFPGVPCIYYGDEAGMEGYADPYNRGPYPWGREDKDSIEWVRMLSALRREHPVLIHGDLQLLAPEPDVFGLGRSTDGDFALIFVSRSDAYRTVSLPKGFRGKDLLSGNVYESELVLPPFGAALLLEEQ